MLSHLRLGALLGLLGWTTIAPAGSLSPCPQEPPTDPPPMRRHRGAWALSSRSRVVFVSAPDRPHGLDIDLAYPERGRWMLHTPDPGENRRTLLYQYGAQLWSIPFGISTSTAAAKSKARDMRLMFALRRALLAWPHQFKWSGEGKERTASLGEHGSLRAVLGKEGRPILLEAQHGDRSPYESLHNLQWKKVDGEMQPASFDMVVNDQKIWHEEILRVDQTLRFLDSYFLPQDRRPQAPPRGTTKNRRFSAPAGFEWEQVLEGDQWNPENLARLRQKALRELGVEGGELQAGMGRVINEQGHGIAVLFLASSIQGTPAGSWRSTGPLWGIVQRLQKPATLTPDLLRGMVVEAAKQGTPARIVVWKGSNGALEVRVEVAPEHPRGPLRPH